MKKILSVFAVVLAFVCLLSVSVSAATPQSLVLEAIKKVAPAELYAEYKVSLENLAKQVTLDEDQANEIIELIEEVGEKVDFAGAEHMEDLSAEDRAFCIEKLDAACVIANVTYTISVADTPEKAGDVVCTFYYNGKSIGTIDTHEVKKTDMADYPAATALAVGAVVVALAAVAFVGTKKFVLSK